MCACHIHDAYDTIAGHYAHVFIHPVCRTLVYRQEVILQMYTVIDHLCRYDLIACQRVERVLTWCFRVLQLFQFIL